ncbi:hypothetical protein [Mesorhizobium sp. B2-7-1]|uniref:hypothetical protein n=1 Tax=Mesorhizobium sp. B2-7-1 TaxID=2589909 RepID=UPI00112D5384|nr:hypothetical protein [Mesorhizobium sp. B2-7-1]TPJ44453.1 hypothetical protein FJ471_32865 [Mesorhizobium sp. B2-7-1]
MYIDRPDIQDGENLPPCGSYRSERKRQALLNGRIDGPHVKVSMEDQSVTPKKKRRSGIPSGNAGEYFVMGELLRRGFDAQLADRNTKGYDLLVGKFNDQALRKAQVKTVRSPPWYVSKASFVGELIDQVTVYVLIGKASSSKPVRYFIARNRDLAANVQAPAGWRDNAFMPLRAVQGYEDRWDILVEVN